jgi:ADP-ribose pyrophosphatase
MKFHFKESYKTPYFSIEEGLDPNNVVAPYYRLTTDESVICCVMNYAGEFIMVEQYRPNIDAMTLELPAGSIKSGELPIIAANREFEEETGMTCDFLPLGNFHLMMNRVNSLEHIYFGFDPQIKEGQKPEEGVKVKRILRSELVKLSINGGYKQIAGLGVIQMASSLLEIDILTSNLKEISKKFTSRIRC